MVIGVDCADIICAFGDGGVDIAIDEDLHALVIGGEIGGDRLSVFHDDIAVVVQSSAGGGGGDIFAGCVDG